MPAPLLFSPGRAQWTRWSQGVSWLDTTWANLVETDPTLSRAHMVLDLQVGGRRALLSSQPCQATSGSEGRRYEYIPGLLEEPTIETVCELGKQRAESRSVDFRLMADPLSLSGLLKEGRILAGEGELSLILDGGDHDRRIPLIRGEVAGGVDFEHDRRQVRLQLSEARQTGAPKVPRTTVDTERWPLAADSALGERYPLTINGYPKIPALRVRDDHGATGLYYLVASPPDGLTVSAVYVNGELKSSGGASAYEPFTATTARDALGTNSTIINFSASAGPWDDGDTVYVDVTAASTLGPVKALEHLLARYTAYGRLGLDLASFGIARSRCVGSAPKILINASGDEGVSVLEYVEGTFLQSLPMLHLVQSGSGLGCVCIDRRNRPGVAPDLILTGRAWPLLDRESDYQESSKDGRYNSFELRYGRNLMDDAWGGSLKADPSTSAACKLGERYDGGVRAMSLDSEIIQSAPLAQYVLGWLVAHNTLPRYKVSWSIPPSAALRIRPGMTVRYTDPDDSGWTNANGYVSRVSFERPVSHVELTLWHPRFDIAL